MRMLRKRQFTTKLHQHLYNLLLSVGALLCAAVLSHLCINATDGNTTNAALIFLFFLILISYHTTGYLYGIICSLIAVFYFNYVYVYPFNAIDFTMEDYPITFLCMIACTTLISTLSSHVTIQSQLLAERERQIAEADMEKMRANLLRAVSHDLRTPLTGIIGNSLTYLENGDQLTDEHKNALIQNIYEDSSWLIHMVENLLTITRIDDNHLTIHMNEECLEEVVAESLQKTQKRHPECEINASIPDELIILPMDAMLIEQVTINLLENALLHSGTEKPIDFIVENHPDDVSFTVRDYGVGLPQDSLSTLFDGTAASAASGTADTHKGMGIGLVICKTIIHAHRGTIIGRNHKHGAEFIFTLPKNTTERMSEEDAG